MRKIVVLPDPFGPTRPTFSPGFSWKEASTNRTCLPYCLVTPANEIIQTTSLLRRPSCRDVLPARGGLFDDAGDVLLQEVALANQIVGGLGDLRQVLIARGVALFDRSARIAGVLALGTRFRERNERPLHSRRDVGRSGSVVEQIPSGVSGKRHRELRHTNPGELVSIGVNLRHQNRERRTDHRWLLRDDATADEVGTIVGVIRLVR